MLLAIVIDSLVDDTFAADIGSERAPDKLLLGLLMLSRLHRLDFSLLAHKPIDVEGLIQALTIVTIEDRSTRLRTTSV